MAECVCHSEQRAAESKNPAGVGLKVSQRDPSAWLGMTPVAQPLVIPSEVEESLIIMLDKARDVFRPSHKATARQATAIDMTGV
jgi:hypothetical protein